MRRPLDCHAVQRDVGGSSGESLSESCPAEESGMGLSKYPCCFQSLAGSSPWDMGPCMDVVLVSGRSSQGQESAMLPGVGALRGTFSGPPQDPQWEPYGASDSKPS